MYNSLMMNLGLELGNTDLSHKIAIFCAGIKSARRKLIIYNKILCMVPEDIHFVFKPVLIFVFLMKIFLQPY
jgi:hypothetical protein